MRALWLCFWCLPLLASAEIYRWTDSQGNVHFTATPAAPGAERLEVRPQVVERDEATRQREERTQRFYEARRAEQAAAQEAANNQQAKQQTECARLRQELNQLNRGGRYFSVDSAGERTYYSDQQIENAKQELSKRLKDCS